MEEADTDVEVSPGALLTTLGLPAGPQLLLSALSPQSPSLGPPLSRVNSFPQGSGLSQETVRTLMHHALTTWGAESDLRFQEVGSQGPTEPDILIDFARAYHQDSYPFDGQGVCLCVCLCVFLSLSQCVCLSKDVYLSQCLSPSQCGCLSLSVCVSQSVWVSRFCVHSFTVCVSLSLIVSGSQ